MDTRLNQRLVYCMLGVRAPCKTKYMKASFYTYFSSAVGTAMIAVFTVSFLEGHTVDIGRAGLFLVVGGGLVYAFYRRTTNTA